MMNKFIPGQEIETTIVAISGDCIFLDMNSKSEGILDKAEVTDENGNCSLNEGDKIKVFYLGEKHGEMRFTTKIAGQNADTSMIENAFKNGIPVEGKVEKEIKGGFEVKLGSTRAFCPYSQMGFKEKDAPETYIGKVLTFKIQEYKENGKNILVSNKAVLQEEHAGKLDKLKTQIQEGMIVEGTIKSLHDYGAFVDINGVQALLPISEISFERVTDISSVLQEGQTITAKVIKADWQHERISVSTKALIADPWDSASKFKEGQKFDGTIARVVEYGIFVTIEKGIDGLVHISTLENVEKNTNLKKVYKAGDKLSVQIKDVDLKAKRISLIPSSTAEQDKTAAKYLSNQDDSDTYNPFAAFFKK